MPPQGSCWGLLSRSWATTGHGASQLSSDLAQFCSERMMQTNSAQQPTGAPKRAPAAERQRRWPDMRTFVALCLALFAACAAPNLSERVAHRLRRIPDPRDCRLPMDGHGRVVLRIGDRIAVCLEPSDSEWAGPGSMAVYGAQGRFKGTLRVLEVFAGHALGVLEREESSGAVQAGDVASCPSP